MPPIRRGDYGAVDEEQADIDASDERRAEETTFLVGNGGTLTKTMSKKTRRRLTTVGWIMGVLPCLLLVLLLWRRDGTTISTSTSTSSTNNGTTDNVEQDHDDGNSTTNKTDSTAADDAKKLPSSSPYITNCPPTFHRTITSEPFVGDASRPGFAEKRDENLVLCEAFDAPQRKEAWKADKTFFGEGNWGFAYYTPENINIQDGALHITPGLFQELGNITSKDGISRPAQDVMLANCRPWPECATYSIVNQNCTIADFYGCERLATPNMVLNPVTSGRLTTEGRFNMLYGRVEVRMRLPQGDWLWPAFWMMPVNATKYGGGWPDSGEFDILESKGNDPHVYGRTGGGRNLFSSCLHYNGNSWWKTRNFASATDVIEGCRNGTVPIDECDWSTNFFTIGLYWSPTTIYAYVLRDNTNAGQGEQEELKLWEVDASKGFGPQDYPLGMNYPPFSNEENTPNKSPQGPYVDESPNKNAPFDQPFYIIINLSVGGDINGCPNPGYWGPAAIWCTHRDPNKPGQTARTVFWENKDLWYPTWEQAKANQKQSFVIDWIKAWQ